jgi:putative membrane protein
MIVRFLLRAIFAGLGLWAASVFIPGIEVRSTGSLIAAALLLGLVNAFVRPILFVLTLPFVLVTFGLFLIVINAAMLMLVAAMLRGFDVHGFWAAMLGSLVVSVASWIGSALIDRNKE